MVPSGEVTGDSFCSESSEFVSSSVFFLVTTSRYGGGGFGGQEVHAWLEGSLVTALAFLAVTSCGLPI